MSSLHDRIDLALRTTPVTGHTHTPGQERFDHHPRPDQKGHTYTYTCALCRNDTNALTEALATVFAEELKHEIERIRAAVTEGKYRDLGRPLTVSDVQVAHEVTRKQLADALDEGLHLNWSQLVDAAQRSNDANTAWMKDVQRVKDTAAAGPPSGAAIPGEWENGWDAAMGAITRALETKEPTT